MTSYSPFSDRPKRQQHVLLPTSWHLYLHSASGRQPSFIVIELVDYKAYHFQLCLIPLSFLLDRCWFHLDQSDWTGPRWHKRDHKPEHKPGHKREHKGEQGQNRRGACWKKKNAGADAGAKNEHCFRYSDRGHHGTQRHLGLFCWSHQLQETNATLHGRTKMFNMLSKFLNKWFQFFTKTANQLSKYFRCFHATTTPPFPSQLLWKRSGIWSYQRCGDQGKFSTFNSVSSNQQCHDQSELKTFGIVFMSFQGLEGQCHGVGEGKCDAYVLMKIGTNEVEVTQG